MTNGVFLNLAETLWIDLYEAGFVELEDVYSFQKWLRSLYLVGHQFIEQPNSLPDSPDTANVKTGVFNFEVGHSISTVVPDLPENCRNIPSKTFWTSDMHDGCRIDTPSVLAHLGQKVFIVGSKGRVGPYPFVFEQEGVTIYEKINPFLKSVYVDHGYDLKQREIDTNYQFFKGDPVMKGVDGFFCQFPASMCELWMPFNRSIFFTPAHRLVELATCFHTVSCFFLF